MLHFFRNLFDTQDFPARWNCGNWSEFHGWLHIVSDFAVFLAYTAIPCIFFYFVSRRQDVKFPPIFWLFCAFIFACGFVHLIEAYIFFNPVYRIAALFKVLTAAVSWATAISLVGVLPQALKLPSIASLNKKLELEAQALRETEQQLNEALNEVQHAKRFTDAILDSVQTGVIVANKQSKMIFENEAARRITGVSVQDSDLKDLAGSYGLYFKDRKTLIPNEKLPLFRALNGETVEGFEMVQIICDKPDRYFRVNATEVVDGNGEILGAVVSFNDITSLQERQVKLIRKHEQAKSDLNNANQQLDQVVNSISDVIWSAVSMDGQMRHVYFSPRVTELTGYDSYEFVSGLKSLLDIVHADDKARISGLMNQLLQKKQQTVQDEYRILKKSGEISWIRNRIRAIPNEHTGEVSIQGIMSDITSEKKSIEVITRSERLTSLGTLSAGIAHELNNPLGAMLLTTELAICQLDADNRESEVKATLSSVLKQIERCSNVVSGVLKFAKNESSTKSNVSLAEIARNSRDLVVARSQPKHVKVLIEDRSQEAEVEGNQTELEQVVVNLLSNAIDATPYRSEVILIVEKSKHAVRISVHDDGGGMDESTRIRAFDPFFTSKRQTGGTGLGLSMCHSIISEHGGLIEIEDSDLKRGAKVSVELPLELTCNGSTG